MLVVIAHVGTPNLEGGFIGVDVFFVISGFLITQLLLREVDRSGTVSIAQFYVRRARRILPAATVVTVIVVLYALVALPLGRLHQTTVDAAWTSVFAANWHFALTGTDYFSTASPSLFQHYWSLAVEEQFYLIWPLLVLLLVPRLGRRSFVILAGVVFVGSLAYSVWATGADPEPTYFNTAARAFELAGGALLGCLMSGPLTSRWRHLAGTAGLAIIVVATIGFDETTPFPDGRHSCRSWARHCCSRPAPVPGRAGSHPARPLATSATSLSRCTSGTGPSRWSSTISSPRPRTSS